MEKFFDALQGKRIASNGKLVGIGILVVICLVPSFFVQGLLGERTQRRTEVAQEIAGKWGSAQVITGPILVLPYAKQVTDAQGVKREETGVVNVLPRTLAYNAVLEPETRSRGIFSAVVYGANVNAKGSFVLPDFTGLTVSQADIRWDKASVVVGISDTRGITEQPVLRWANADIAFEPGAQHAVAGTNGVHAFTPLGAAQGPIEFGFAFNVRGSEQMEFTPVGGETTVTVSSTWPLPSFIGAYLPTEREVADNFSAKWSVSSFGRSYPQQWVDGDVSERTVQESVFGVSLKAGVDFYTMTERTIKYAILFIAVTFLAFFLFEVLSGLRIHPFQYLLVGFALVLFYLLLLSLSERLGFKVAYALSTLATVGLITAYSAKVLRANIKALVIAGVLLLLYSYLYIIVQLEDLALLYGSILLFVLLSLTMYLTRNIDWYRSDTSDTASR